MDAVLGIDIAKDKFAVTLRTRDGKRRRKSCPNTAAGFAELAAWLARHGAPHVHACLEATGTYGDALAIWLHDAGHVVSVVNPAIIHAYARTHLTRSKTDRIDADLIADYTATQRPPAWAPPALEIRQLQALGTKRFGQADNLQDCAKIESMQDDVESQRKTEIRDPAGSSELTVIGGCASHPITGVLLSGLDRQLNGREPAIPQAHEPFAREGNA